MHRLLPLGALLLIAGCQNVVGPFGCRNCAHPDDPLLTIGEQQRRGRSCLALPENSPKVVPQIPVAGPDAAGR